MSESQPKFKLPSAQSNRETSILILKRQTDEIEDIIRADSSFRVKKRSSGFLTVNEINKLVTIQKKLKNALK